jgi:hypothetical protein
MKKLIIMDPVWICGLDLISGTSDEKCKYMGYDTEPAHPVIVCLQRWEHLHTPPRLR